MLHRCSLISGDRNFSIRLPTVRDCVTFWSFSLSVDKPCFFVFEPFLSRVSWKEVQDRGRRVFWTGDPESRFAQYILRIWGLKSSGKLRSHESEPLESSDHAGYGQHWIIHYLSAAGWRTHRTSGQKITTNCTSYRTEKLIWKSLLTGESTIKLACSPPR